MDVQRNPEIQEAEEEFHDLQKEVQQETPLFVLANEVPRTVTESAPEDPNFFPTQRRNLFPMGGLEGIPATSTS